MNGKTNAPTEVKITALLGFGLLIYLALRAGLVPFVHDEAATFFFYVHTGRFLPKEAGLDANNHFLNSSLTYLSYKLFGSSEFALRIPNLLLFPVYLIFWFKLSRYISSPLIRWTFLLSGLFAHNLIEFFALSRGYGMSIALLTACLYYLVKAFKDNRKSFFLPAALFIILALSANLSLLNTALLVMGLLVLSLFMPNQNKNYSHPLIFKCSLFSIFLCAAGIFLCTQRLIEMRAKGTLYYGSGNGFWTVTVRSLLKALLGTNGLLSELLVAAFVLFCCAGALYLFFSNKEKLIVLLSPALLFPFLLFGNTIASILLYKLFKVNYPEDRVGLYFLPLLIGSVCFIADSLLKKHPGSILRFSVLPLLVFPAHFALKANLSHTSFYYVENIPHRFYEKVAAYSKKGECPPTIGGYRMRELAWDFQNFRHGGGGALLDFRSHPQSESDFQISIAEQLGAGANKYDLLDYDESSNLSLLKRKNFLQRHLLLKKEVAGTQTASEFFELYKGAVDSLVGASLFIEAQLTLNSVQIPFRTWLVVSVNDGAGKDLLYERLPLDWVRTYWDGKENNLVNGLLLHALPTGSKSLVCYLWNMDKVSYSLANSEISINRLNDCKVQ